MDEAVNPGDRRQGCAVKFASNNVARRQSVFAPAAAAQRRAHGQCRCGALRACTAVHLSARRTSVLCRARTSTQRCTLSPPLTSRRCASPLCTLPRLEHGWYTPCWAVTTRINKR
jgi:hypothetical protein